MGAATETEMKRETPDEDALSATRAAVEEGVVPGGGVALLKIAPVDKLNKTGDNTSRHCEIGFSGTLETNCQ